MNRKRTKNPPRPGSQIIGAFNVVGVFDRLLNATRAFITTLRADEISPDVLNANWDKYESRLARYAWYTSYNNNNVYNELQVRVLRIRQDNRLYRYTRGLRNPVSRLTDICTAKAYGGSIDYQTFASGAIPVLQASDDMKESIRQLLIWSNWGVNKSLYARNAAMLGDSVIKIVDEPDKRRVRLEVLHPSRVKDATFDSVGNVTECCIEYDYEEESAPGNYRTYTYREEIDDKEFRTFRNNEPFGFYNDASGNPVDHWANDYGFVPLRVAHYKDMGLQWGVNPFHASIPKIDDVNDAASALNDYLRRAMNPQWMLAGAKKPDAGSATPTNAAKRDEERVIYAPSGTTATSLVHQVDVTSALANIQAQMEELKEDLPQLALGDVFKKNNLSATGARIGASSAVDLITEANGNLDAAFIAAVQMGVSIGAQRKYDNFTQFNANSYAAGDLAFYIKERDIVEDKLSKIDEFNSWKASGAPESKLWSILGASEQEIAEWTAQKQAQADLFAARLDQATNDNTFASGAAPNDGTAQ